MFRIVSSTHPYCHDLYISFKRKQVSEKSVTYIKNIFIFSAVLNCLSCSPNPHHYCHDLDISFKWKQVSEKSISYIKNVFIFSAVLNCLS